MTSSGNGIASAFRVASRRWSACPASAEDAIEAMRTFEGRMENTSTIYLTDSHGTLVGAVPLVIARTASYCGMTMQNWP